MTDDVLATHDGPGPVGAAAGAGAAAAAAAAAADVIATRWAEEPLGLLLPGLVGPSGKGRSWAVDDLGLPPRARNALRRSGWEHLGDLAETTGREVLGKPGIGPTTLSDIVRVIVLAADADALPLPADRLRRRSPRARAGVSTSAALGAALGAGAIPRSPRSPNEVTAALAGLDAARADAAHATAMVAELVRALDTCLRWAEEAGVAPFLGSGGAEAPRDVRRAADALAFVARYH